MNSQSSLWTQGGSWSQLEGFRKAIVDSLAMEEALIDFSEGDSLEDDIREGGQLY